MFARITSCTNFSYLRPNTTRLREDVLLKERGSGSSPAAAMVVEYKLRSEKTFAVLDIKTPCSAAALKKASLLASSAWDTGRQIGWEAYPKL